MPKIDWTTEKIVQPKELKRMTFKNIDLNTLVPYINWRMFLIAWKVSGDFSGIENINNAEQAQKWLAEYDGLLKEKAQEATKIILDGKRILQQMIDNHLTTANAVLQIVPASKAGDNVISIYQDEEHTEQISQFVLARQNKPDANNQCWSLSDIGMFVATTGVGLKEYTDKLISQGNDYEAIMMKLLADRLVEALSEWLHQQVRTQIWGYSPNEKLT